MKKIERILFPTDFSDTANNAFEYAIWFASKYKADIELWHFVMPQIEPMDFPVLSGNVTEQKMAIAKEVMQSFIKSGLRQAHEHHELEVIPTINAHVALGTSAKFISNKVSSENIDLIIMGTQGEHNTFERIFGSVSSATIRKSECPVLVVPQQSVNYKITNVAYAAQLDDSDLYHIWEFRNLLSSFNPQIKIVNILEYVEDTEISMDELKRFFEERGTSENISFHSLIGDDKLELLDRFIENNKIDLLVMHKPESSFFDRFFHDSLTKKVVLNLKIPMLVIK